MKRVFLLLAAASCSAPSTSEVEVEVRQAYADLSSRDWVRFESHFAPGAVLVFRTREGRPEILTVAEFLAKERKALEGRPIFEERCESVEVRIHRDVAQAWSRFRGRVGSKERLATWSGVDAYTLVRTGEGWRIASIAVGTDE